MSADPTADPPQPAAGARAWQVARRVLAPIASLKLTVVLLAMSIFIVLAGTFAQVEKDIWEVVRDYFRIDFSSVSYADNWFAAVFFSMVAEIEIDMFFPAAFFGDLNVPGAIYFPKGWLIGLVMSFNLLSAHLLRFKVQAKGMRLIWGLVVLGAGAIATFAVVQSGSNVEGIQQSFFAQNWGRFWQLLIVGVAFAFLSALYGAVMVENLAVSRRVGFGVLAAAIGGLLIWLLYPGNKAQLSEPSLRILWQLIKATFAGGVLLVGCILLFRKRAGVVLLHGGIGLMMLSELLVGTTAKEAYMTFLEDETRNFVYDGREVEIAIIEPGEAGGNDKVTVIAAPAINSHLPTENAPGEVISHEALPFDLRIMEYYPSAVLVRARAGEPVYATHGTGALYVLVPRDESTGLDSSADQPAAYVECLDKQTGDSLGVYLTSVGLLPINGVRQAVMVGDETYDISLRFKREYLGYDVTLKSAERENYIGTESPKDYHSNVAIADAGTGAEFEHRIWMNNPLRYRNRTYYQTGFEERPVTNSQGQREIKGLSTLQVVTNDGWMIPYIACMIVAVGMLFHFGVALLRYLGRRQREIAAEASPQEDDTAAGGRAERRRAKRNRSGGSQSSAAGESGDEEPLLVAWRRRLLAGSRAEIFARLFPALFVALCAIWVLSLLRPASVSGREADIHAFGKLPVVYEGRVKPFDTLARTSLRQISTKQTFFDAKDTRQPAIRWFLDLATGQAHDHKVVRIDNPDVVGQLKLPPRKSHLYSMRELVELETFRRTGAASDPQIRDAIIALGNTATEQLTTAQKKLGEAINAVSTVLKLEDAFNPLATTDVEALLANPRELNDWRAAIRQEHQRLLGLLVPYAVPVDFASGTWFPFATTAAESQLNAKLGAGRTYPAADGLLKALNAYRAGNAIEFNSAVKEYREFLAKESSAATADASVDYDQEKHDFEAYFNHVEPFYHALVLYVLAGLLAIFAWMGWSRPLNRASFWLLAFTFVFHSLALIARIYISGRPPVTNLYTTGIFIAWGCVAMGMALEWWSKLGLGNIIAAVCGFGGLLIAHLLTTSVATFRGDTFTVMIAVLDTQFWLATHVVIINLGYAATGLSGALGALYVLLGVCTPKLSQKVDRHLVRMMYGTLCFAIFFSFVGTVLGGLWADDSWGRFWGWDPKENGALIIVLWNAIVLHARWDGMVKDRGLAVLCILGNICVTWSWFMVNELGVGLHSYGFTEGVLFASMAFIISQLAIAVVGTALPKSKWWSVKAGKQRESNVA